MEIVLLFIILLLMVIFETSRNSKINALERKIASLETYLKKLTALPAQKDSVLKETVKAQTGKPEANVQQEQETSIKKEEIKPVEEKPVPTKVVLPVKQEENPEPQKENAETQRTETIKTPVKEAPVASAQKPVAPQEDWYTRFRKNNPDLEKFIGENILSKVAITILVLGIAFFVKFAIDKNWINEIARVGIGILCGGIVLGFAHRLRKRFAAFSSVLVAGGIAVFYFTIGIGFHQYHLFHQATAFIIMLLITAFSVFISVSYNRVELAALSILGGFATPFMVSTGQGNYLVLFTYILILDIGMLVLAYLRKWNLVNILAYVLTMLLYTIWLETKVIGIINGPYKGALIFGAIFYMIFILMNVVNNVKEKRKFDAYELSILLSNTFLFYGEGMHVLHYYHEELQGLFSVCMAMFNLACAWLLYKKFKADEKLVYLLIGLTLTFITLAAPVQLHGNYITLFWALESLLLMWLAQRSGIIIYRFASVLILGLMLISLSLDWIQVYRPYDATLLQNILLNKGFITGLVAAGAAGGTFLLLRREKILDPEHRLRYAGIDFHIKNYMFFLRLVFIALLYCTGIFELMYQLNERLQQRIAFFIIVEAYHLLFILGLVVGLRHTSHRYLKNGLYALSLISVGVYAIGFTLLPVFDLKEDLIRTEASHIGLWFHYVCLATVITLALWLYRKRGQKKMDLPYGETVITSLVSAALVYLCSSELVTHTLLFTLKPVTELSNPAIIHKLGEFSSTIRHTAKIGFPILWGILAFAFLSAGMKNHNKAFRISGLALIALIILKLFTYDIREASEAGKIVAFIILGIVLLIISFMYQKIKALLIDGPQKKETESKTEP